MARKPIHVLAHAARPQGRDVIWAAIRRRREFSLLELEHESRIKIATIRTFVSGLVRAGYLEVSTAAHRDAKGMQVACRWRLVKDTGVEAPRVTRDGKPVTQGQSRQQLWRAMRSARTFTHGELAYIASTDTCVVSEVDAKSYVLLLARAGYLTVIEKGNPRHQAVYRLAKNTGPKPPQIQRFKQVWDPNLKQVMWTSGGAQ